MPTTLSTWGGRSRFTYDGSVEGGTDITYGEGRRARVDAHHFVDLRHRFLNREESIGTSRTDTAANSLGGWLQANVTRTAIATYVGSILVHEGYAERVGDHDIRITR
jgi:hypothetical protein